MNSQKAAILLFIVLIIALILATIAMLIFTEQERQLQEKIEKYGCDAYLEAKILSCQNAFSFNFTTSNITVIP